MTVMIPSPYYDALPTAPLRWTPEQQALIDGLNFDEERVESYCLPDALTFRNGDPVVTVQEWRERRRPEVLELFQRHVYGKMPPPLVPTVRIVEEGESKAFGRPALRRQIEVGFEGWGRTVDFILYLPLDCVREGKPVPCFLGLSFFGNEASFNDPAVRICRSWLNPIEPVFHDTRASEQSRGCRTARWPVAEILERGYGVATAYYGDLEPDYPGGERVGVRTLFPDSPWDRTLHGDAPGAIAAWAWGLSRLMDVLETMPEVDARRVILTGHSRLGKTALWAAANDQRFAAVVSNNSGCGGAAISRRNFGETLRMLSGVRDYWFAPNAQRDCQSDASMPVDQHLLIASIAPRPVLVASALDDHGADPKGEFLGAFHASKVYELLGAGTLGAIEPPAPNQLTGQGICYYVRPGEHEIKPEDWRFHLAFADRLARPLPH